MPSVRKVGFLFSSTGSTSIVEIGLLEAGLLAIHRANADNAISINPIIVDIKSDPAVAAKASYDLLTSHKVDILVGCYMSSCRKAIIPVLEETGGTLIYPTIYEGEEAHPQIFYFGATPNQQIDPLLAWTMTNLSKYFILVGSDYIYSQSTNRQIRTIIEGAGGITLHETYFPLGCIDFSEFLPLLRKLIIMNPNAVILSTLVGKSIIAFYNQYRVANLHTPIVSPITSEVEFRAMGVDSAVGHYFADGHLTSPSKTHSNSFLSEYHLHHCGKSINGMMSGLYDSIQLLGRCYREANINTRDEVAARKKLHSALKSLTCNVSDNGIIMDASTQHAWLWTRISKITNNGGINELWKSPGPMPPRPYGQKNKENTPLSILSVRPKASPPPQQIIGNSRKIKESIRLAHIAANTSCPVLLHGETGTGKELFARTIHESSNRCNGPFVPINCAAIPKDLIVSELFGYEGGAFTGATKKGKKGKFEQANGGTLFLDEIAQLPQDSQAILLRVLQEHKVSRIGSQHEVNVDVRVIAATNADISPDTQSTNGFRPDLFYRLSVFQIDLPALRSRKEDIKPIAEAILSRLNNANGCCKSFSDDAIKEMLNYPWPGNIRELENWIKRAFYVAQNKTTLDTCHFPKFHTSPKDILLVDRKDDLPQSSIQHPILEEEVFTVHSEKKLIMQALVASAYNMSQSARMLGISRSTLYRKVKKFGIISPVNRATMNRLTYWDNNPFIEKVPGNNLP